MVDELQARHENLESIVIDGVAVVVESIEYVVVAQVKAQTEAIVDLLDVCTFLLIGRYLHINVRFSRG